MQDVRNWASCHADSLLQFPLITSLVNVAPSFHSNEQQAGVLDVTLHFFAPVTRGNGHNPGDNCFISLTLIPTRITNLT